MRVGMFYPEVDITASEDIKFMQIGNNTGNNVFWTSLRRLLKIEKIPYDYEEKGIALEKYDAIITTDLIWIRQGDVFEFLEKLIEQTSKPIIPISVGLQAKEFDLNYKIADRTVALLKKIEERAVLGVRGEYTAKILEKHGIHNMAVIGCPSMYYWNNPLLKIESNIVYPNNFLCNFKTFYGLLSRKEKHFLSYAANYQAPFVEQTRLCFKEEMANDLQYFNYVNTWLQENTHIYFDLKHWMKDTCLYDFSIGGRFHGNVVSLWNNIKSLFVITDSRTRELTSHFMLPSIDMEDFDKDKDIRYYYELADYSEFNQLYAKRYEEFVDFLAKNGISPDNTTNALQFAKNNAEKLEYEKRLLAIVD